MARPRSPPRLPLLHLCPATAAVAFLVSVVGVYASQTPILVLEAGLDGMVRADGIRRFCSRVPGAEYRLFPGAYHDLFDERDDIRQVP